MWHYFDSTYQVTECLFAKSLRRANDLKHIENRYHKLFMRWKQKKTKKPRTFRAICKQGKNDF